MPNDWLKVPCNLSSSSDSGDDDNDNDNDMWQPRGRPNRGVVQVKPQQPKRPDNRQKICGCILI